MFIPYGSEKIKLELSLYATTLKYLQGLGPTIGTIFGYNNACPANSYD